MQGCVRLQNLLSEARSWLSVMSYLGSQSLVFDCKLIVPDSILQKVGRRSILVTIRANFGPKVQIANLNPIPRADSGHV